MDRLFGLVRVDLPALVGNIVRPRPCQTSTVCGKCKHADKMFALVCVGSLELVADPIECRFLAQVKRNMPPVLATVCLI